MWVNSIWLCSCKIYCTDTSHLWDFLLCNECDSDIDSAPKSADPQLCQRLCDSIISPLTGNATCLKREQPFHDCPWPCDTGVLLPQWTWHWILCLHQDKSSPWLMLHCLCQETWDNPSVMALSGIVNFLRRGSQDAVFGIFGKTISTLINQEELWRHHQGLLLSSPFLCHQESKETSCIRGATWWEGIERAQNRRRNVLEEARVF